MQGDTHMGLLLSPANQGLWEEWQQSGGVFATFTEFVFMVLRFFYDSALILPLIAFVLLFYIVNCIVNISFLFHYVHRWFLLFLSFFLFLSVLVPITYCFIMYVCDTLLCRY